MLCGITPSGAARIIGIFPVVAKVEVDNCTLLDDRAIRVRAAAAAAIARRAATLG